MNYSIGILINYSISKLINYSMGKPINYSIGKLINYSIGILINYSIGKLINYSSQTLIFKCLSLFEINVNLSSNTFNILNNKIIKVYTIRLQSYKWYRSESLNRVIKYFKNAQ